jgi:hypothetical protein
MKKENVLSEEAAQAQLDLFCEYYEVNTEDENLQGVLLNFKNSLMKGRLEIDNSNNTLIVTQHLKFPIEISKDHIVKAVTYREMDGKARVLINNPLDKPYENIFNLMSELSGTSKNLFLKMKIADLKACESVGGLFF